MEPTLKPIHAAGILLLLLVVSLRGTSAASGFLADYAIAFIFIIVFLQGYYLWATYSSIRNLEALDEPERRYYLSFVHQPDTRATIERALAVLPDSGQGSAESFHPSPALRRLLEWPFWLGAAASIAVLAARLSGATLSAWHWALAVLSLAVAVYSWSRLRHLKHSIEVSSFGIAEVYPDGGRRFLRWRSLAAIQASRWRRLVVLRPLAGGGHLSFSYDTTRVVRLCELIVSHATAASEA